jgi:thiol-disulfide isomerase/thioredoxin
VVIAAALTLPPGIDRAGPPITGWMGNFTPATAARPAPPSPFFARGGKRLTLADFRGKVVLVNFWATWCAPCLREMPSLVRLQARLGGPGFTVLALSQDLMGWPVMEPFIRRLGLDKLPVYLDQRGVFAGLVGVIGLPTSILYDRAGNELGRLVGIAEWDSPEAATLIKHYMAVNGKRAQ